MGCIGAPLIALGVWALYGWAWAAIAAGAALVALDVAGSATLAWAASRRPRRAP